ncbi:MAG TPA: DUF4271 domain-containing protein [Bacteroidia bacterium]|nr:DUF4271 domain-containing protein [Bacteroidia bacterium]
MNISPNFRFSSTEHWITALLFLCVLLFAWVKTAYPKKVSLIFREVFTATMPEDDSGINPASIGMFVIFICTSVILGMHIMHLYGYDLYHSVGKEFASLALFLFLIYAVKTLVILFSGFVFDQQQRAWEYLSEIYVFAHFLGLVLLPAALLFTYAPNINSKAILEAVFIAIALLFVYRTIKMFILMTNKGLSMMYLFLYICALEILPFALLVKYAKVSLGM